LGKDLFEPESVWPFLEAFFAKGSTRGGFFKNMESANSYLDHLNTWTLEPRFCDGFYPLANNSDI
jgi:hypothetical protein